MDTRAIISTLLQAVITILVVPLIIQGIRWLAAKMGLTKFTQAIAIVTSSVQAIEQLAKTNGWDGVVKFDQAYRAASDMLKAHGIAISDADLRVLIESAVLAVKAAIPTVLQPGAEVIPGTLPTVLPTSLMREASDT